MTAANRGSTAEPSPSGRPLTPGEREAFLMRGLIARLACLDESGWPYSVPVWFDWDGSRFWIVGGETSAWVRHLTVDERVSLCIDEPETLRRVVCQGQAQLVEGPTVGGPWVTVGQRMSARYLGDRAAAYDAAMASFAGALFAITPVRLTTWQGPSRRRSGGGTAERP